jgi:hypothetical protein
MRRQLTQLFMASATLPYLYQAPDTFQYEMGSNNPVPVDLKAFVNESREEEHEWCWEKKRIDSVTVKINGQTKEFYWLVYRITGEVSPSCASAASSLKEDCLKRDAWDKYYVRYRVPLGAETSSQRQNLPQPVRRPQSYLGHYPRNWHTPIPARPANSPRLQER